MKNVILVCLVIFSTISCSKDDDSTNDSITNQVLEGTLNNKPFKALGGMAFDSSFNNEELFSINLTNVAAGCETSIFDYVLSISVTVPKQLGVFTERNIVTQDRSDNTPPLNNLQQTVEITALSETEITGKMKLNSISDDNSFEGTFTVPICNN